MKTLFNSRQFHKALAPWVFLPLFISSITGLLYRVSKDLLGYSRDQVHWLMSLHEGEWLGDNGELIYVILNSPWSFMDARNRIPNVFKNNFIYQKGY